jgi:hypothetical protein
MTPTYYDLVANFEQKISNNRVKKRRNQTTTRTQRQRARAGWGVSMGVKQYARAWDGVRDDAPLPVASFPFLTPGISLANSNNSLDFLAVLASRRQNSAEKPTTVSQKDSAHREL